MIAEDELAELNALADRVARTRGGYIGNARGVLMSLLEEPMPEHTERVEMLRDSDWWRRTQTLSEATMSADALRTQLEALKQLPTFFHSTMKLRMVPAIQLEKQMREQLRREGELWVSESELRVGLDAVLAALQGAPEPPASLDKLLRLRGMAWDEARRRHLADSDADGIGVSDGHGGPFNRCEHDNCRLVHSRVDELAVVNMAARAPHPERTEPVKEQHFHSEECYGIGPGDTEVLICGGKDRKR